MAAGTSPTVTTTLVRNGVGVGGAIAATGMPGAPSSVVSQSAGTTRPIPPFATLTRVVMASPIARRGCPDPSAPCGPSSAACGADGGAHLRAGPGALHRVARAGEGVDGASRNGRQAAEAFRDGAAGERAPVDLQVDHGVWPIPLSGAAAAASWAA